MCNTRFLFAAGKVYFRRRKIFRFIAVTLLGAIAALSFLTPVSLACASCLLNPSWLHHYPDEGEMAEALLSFLLNYRPQLTEGGLEGVIDGMWYRRIEYPAVDSFSTTLKEIILCWEELFDNDSSVTRRYGYTFMAHDPQKGYYFFSFPAAAFPSREKLEDYLAEFVIASVSGKTAVGDPVAVNLSGLKDLSASKNGAGKLFSFSPLFIGIFAAAVFVLWRRKKIRP